MENVVKVLFVCTGNTCRSPMAEYYFNSEIKKNGGKSAVAGSCGLFANPGEPMSKNALEVLASKNIAGGEHRSRQIDTDVVKNSDLVCAVTSRHEARLKQRFPEFAEKISAMAEEIGDPFGGSLESYERCFESIQKSVDIIIKSLSEGNV